MPFPDGTFDLVASRFAMHQFPYPLDILDEMVRVCKPGGKVVSMLLKTLYLRVLAIWGY